MIKKLEKRLEARGLWIAILTILWVVTAGVLVLDLSQPMTTDYESFRQWLMENL